MSQDYEDEPLSETCPGTLKFYLSLAGTINQCPDCEHWNAISKAIHGFLDDFEIDEDENWELWCQCCGSVNNMAYD